MASSPTGWPLSFENGPYRVPHTGVPVACRQYLAGEPLVWHMDTSTQPTRRPHPNAGYLVRGVDETLEHVAAGRGISFLTRSATVFYSHPNISYVPVPDLASEQVCLAMAASHTSPVVDDFFTAAQAAADITAECGNYEMWQLGSGAVSTRRSQRKRIGHPAFNHARGVFRGGSRAVRTCPETGVEA